MKALVIYKSKTGFTKWYAEIIAKEVEGELIEFKDITIEKMSEYDIVVYGGGLYAGMINGFKKVKEMFNKSSTKKIIVFATGGTPNVETEKIDEAWRNNLSEEELTSIPHFYMQAGICYENMSFMDKTLMKMMVNVLSKEQSKNNSGEEFGYSIKSSYNISDKKYSEPLIKCVLEGQGNVL